MWHRRDVLKQGLLGVGAAAYRPGSLPVEPGKTSWIVSEYGARGDGKFLNTRAFQEAIDLCSAAGGGTVYIPSGTFLTGTLQLKDGVILHLAPSAVILGSQDRADYPEFPFGTRDLDIGGFNVWALIYARGATNIAIEGRGTINGNGKPFPPVPHAKNRDVPTSFRPRLLYFDSCRRVAVREVTLRDSGCWTAHIARSSEVVVDGISLYSNFFYNQDGIVLDSCDGAVVSNCHIDASDDAIVLKSSFREPCQNIAIANCVLTTTCAAIKLGSQSLGGFRNISIMNCACYGCALGGLKMEAVDGGDLEDICVSNLTMHQVSAPITVILGNRAEGYGFKDLPSPRPVSRLRNVIISNIRATVVARNEQWRIGNTCLITGLPGHPVSGLHLESLSFTFPGGGTTAEALRPIHDRPAAYPENTMLGVLPAYAFYLRHASGITMDRVHLELAAGDQRPAIVCEDVENLRVTGLVAASNKEVPLLRFSDTRGALLQACCSTAEIDCFLDVHGATSRDIALAGNDLRNAKEPVRNSDGFNGKDVQLEGNLRYTVA